MNIHRTVLQLKSREYITPRYIRLTLTGDDITPFAQCTVGTNNKIFIPPQGVTEVHFPPPPGEPAGLPEELAIRRTYTHAGMSLDKKEMYIDFIAHGLTGPASRFAMEALPGAKLGVAMKIKETALAPEVDFYCLIGDTTAIPVIRATLASLPPHAQGAIFIEIEADEEKQDFQKPANMQLNWLINPEIGTNTRLAQEAIAYLEENQTTDSRFAFVACEYENVRLLRNYLRKEKEWTNKEVSAYSYWKHGVAETQSEKSRRAEKESV